MLSWQAKLTPPETTDRCQVCDLRGTFLYHPAATAAAVVGSEEVVVGVPVAHPLRPCFPVSDSNKVERIRPLWADADGAARILLAVDTTWVAMHRTVPEADLDAQLAAYVNTFLVAPVNVHMAGIVRGGCVGPLPRLPPVALGQFSLHYAWHYDHGDATVATKDDARRVAALHNLPVT